MIKKIETGLQDCYIVEPSVFGDDRGYFSPFFIQKDMDDNNLYFDGVVQCNRSKSSKGVVRGLHFQKTFPQRFSFSIRLTDTKDEFPECEFRKLNIISNSIRNSITNQTQTSINQGNNIIHE